MKTFYLFVFCILSACSSQKTLPKQVEKNFSTTHLFFDLTHEVEHHLCSIKGQIPEWLSGILFRNGPAKFQVGTERVSSWFDGLAMIHAFEFTPEQVFYSNQFLRSQQYHEMVEEGVLNFEGFAQYPCSGLFKNQISRFFPSEKPVIKNAVVSIAEYAEKLVALTETPLPVIFDPKTLTTVGNFSYTDSLPKRDIFESAHPQHDHSETVNYLVRYGHQSHYVIWKMLDQHSNREVIGEIPIEMPSYMHSFALTEHYVILVEFPFVVNPLDLIRMDKPFIKNFQWKPERGTVFLVVDRSSGKVVTKIKTEPFFAFHHVNAFDKDGTIYIDIVTYPNAYVIETVTQTANDESKDLNTQLQRFTISLSTDTLSQEPLFDRSLEMPRIASSTVAQPYRYCYATDYHLPSSDKDIRPLYKIDVKTKAYQSWSERGCFPGEPIFVPRPGSSEEDDGVVLSLILDFAKDRSFLLILDARNFSEIARAEAPHAIPVGLHGLWNPSI